MTLLVEALPKFEEEIGNVEKSTGFGLDPGVATLANSIFPPHAVTSFTPAVPYSYWPPSLCHGVLSTALRFMWFLFISSKIT